MLVAAAKGLFGGWGKAVEASGHQVPPRPRKWTPATVVARIHARLRGGKRVHSVAVVEEEQSLYGAGRNVFGSWAEALKAAGVG